MPSPKPEDEAPQKAPPAPKVPACPDCGAPLVVYTGVNPVKVGTGFCETCGQRHRIE